MNILTDRKKLLNKIAKFEQYKIQNMFMCLNISKFVDDRSHNNRHGEIKNNIEMYN